MRVAEQGIAELGRFVDSLITIPNEKLLSVLGPQTTLLDAFKAANEVLQGAVQGIAELITRPGLINVDFADVRTVMVGDGHGDDGLRRRRAARTARGSRPKRPCRARCSRTSICRARNGILVNVTAGMDLAIGEFQEVGDTVKQFASDDATVVIGTVIDPEMNDEIRVTVVATGLGQAVGGSATSRSKVVRKCRRHWLRQSSRRASRTTTTWRSPRIRASGRWATASTGTESLEDLLDIPAFLRRQAD